MRSGTKLSIVLAFALLISIGANVWQASVRSRECLEWGQIGRVIGFREGIQYTKDAIITAFAEQDANFADLRDTKVEINPVETSTTRNKP